jgi:hypothetical protein
MAYLVLPAGKGGQQQEALRSCTERSNFGIHFWPWVTLVTLLNRGKRGLFGIKTLILGSKMTLNHVECLLYSFSDYFLLLYWSLVSFYAGTSTRCPCSMSLIMSQHVSGTYVIFCFSGSCIRAIFWLFGVTV